MPVICEAWLADRDRVRWTRERLGPDRPKGEIDQRMGQLFCDAMNAWGRDLEARGVRNRQAQRTAIEQASFDEWTLAMDKYCPSSS